MTGNANLSSSRSRRRRRTALFCFFRLTQRFFTEPVLSEGEVFRMTGNEILHCVQNDRKRQFVILEEPQATKDLAFLFFRLTQRFFTAFRMTTQSRFVILRNKAILSSSRSRRRRRIALCTGLGFFTTFRMTRNGILHCVQNDKMALYRHCERSEAIQNLDRHAPFTPSCPAGVIPLLKPV